MASDRIARAPAGLQAVQGGRQGAREAVLPLRDAPRHDHVARRRDRDHRARGHLEVDASRATTRAPPRAGSASSTTSRPTRAPSASSRGPTGTSTSSSTCCGSSSGRPRSSSARSGSRRSCSCCCSRCRSSTCAPSGGRCGARSRWSPRPRRPLDGHPDLPGRDREGGARLGADPATSRPGRRRRASSTTRTRSRARSSSPRSAASTATPTSARATTTSARPTSRAEGAKNKGIAFEIAHLKCPSCVNTGSPMPSSRPRGSKNLTELATFLDASKGPK